MIYPHPVIIGFIMLVGNLFFEYSSLTRRYSVGLHVAVRVATLAVILLGRVHLALNNVENGLPFYYLLSSLFFLDCVVLFEESLAQKLFLFFMNWGITSFLATISVWLAPALPGGDSSGIESGLIYLGSYGLLLPFYVRYWRKPIRDSLRLFDYGRPFYAIYPLLCFLLFLLLFGPSIPPLRLRFLILMLLFETLAIFTYYLLFAHVKGVYGRLQSEASLQASERLIALQKKYYEEMERGIHAQRKLLHDNRHHLMALSSLSSKRDYDEMNKYLQSLLANAGRTPTRNYCENSIANAIIGGYIETAVAKGIAVNVSLDLPSQISINEYDLCVFFGNTIENAIEACDRIPIDSELFKKRCIEVRSRLTDDCLVVRIENSCQPEQAPPKGVFPSSKGKHGGMGLESVRTIVDQYRGCLSCEREGDRFVLSALLYSQPEKAAPASRAPDVKTPV